MRFLILATGVAIGFLIKNKEAVQDAVNWWADKLDPDWDDEVDTTAADDLAAADEEIIIIKKVIKKKKAVQADDLQKIRGIGPKTADLLHKAGISTFDQLAEATPDQLREIMRDGGARVVNPESWPGQAKAAASDR